MMPVLHVPATLDIDATEALAAALEHASREAGPVELRGGTGVFCEGLDLAAVAGGGDDRCARAVRCFARVLSALRTHTQPTLAIVDGDARGGGLGLLAACDIVVATRRSRFGLPESLLGLAPAVIYPALRERMRVQQIRQWCLTGDARSASDAWAAGLVDDVIEEDALEPAARAWRRRLSRVSPDAVSALRRLTAEDVRGEAGFDRGAAITTASLGDAALRDRIRTFLTDGVLPWEGR